MSKRVLWVAIYMVVMGACAKKKSTPAAQTTQDKLAINDFSGVVPVGMAVSSPTATLSEEDIEEGGFIIRGQLGDKG